MKKALTQEERYQQMMTEPVEPLIIRMAIPTIISMLVTSIYNMADTFFVSQLNTSASGAVGVIFSLMAIIQAVAFMIGMGAGNNIARLLGQQKTEQAAVYAAVGYFTELLVGVVLAVIGLSNIEPLVYALGATETIAPYAMDYASYILYAAPFVMCSFGMNAMLRFQGNSFYSMIGIATGGVLNMILDPILIFGFDMGISGAAIATAFSQFVSFVILTAQCNFMKSCISIRLRNFRPNWNMYGEIVHMGIPSLARQGIASISVIMLNFAAQPYGDAAIAAFSIVNRFTMFMNSALIGFGQGFQPVCGFNFGAKNYQRVLSAYAFMVKLAVVVIGSLSVLAFIFANPIIAAFRRDDPAVIAVGTLALRLQCVTLPIAAQVTLSNIFVQTIGYGFRASLIALLRQGIFLIPLLLVLPPVMGLFGLQLAQPVADMLSGLVAFFIVRNIVRDLRRMQKEEELSA